MVRYQSHKTHKSVSTQLKPSTIAENGINLIVGPPQDPLPLGSFIVNLSNEEANGRNQSLTENSWRDIQIAQELQNYQQ